MKHVSKYRVFVGLHGFVQGFRAGVEGPVVQSVFFLFPGLDPYEIRGVNGVHVDFSKRRWAIQFAAIYLFAWSNPLLRGLVSQWQFSCGFLLLPFSTIPQRAPSTERFDE